MRGGGARLELISVRPHRFVIKITCDIEGEINEC